jgi:hypothetical protein
MGDKLAPRTMQDTQIRIYKNAYSDEFCDKVIKKKITTGLTLISEEIKLSSWM